LVWELALATGRGGGAIGGGPGGVIGGGNIGGGAIVVADHVGL